MHKRIVINFYIKACNVYVHTHWKYFNHSSTSYFVDYMKCFISFFYIRAITEKVLAHHSPIIGNYVGCICKLFALDIDLCSD